MTRYLVIVWLREGHRRIQRVVSADCCRDAEAAIRLEISERYQIACSEAVRLPEGRR